MARASSVTFPDDEVDQPDSGTADKTAAVLAAATAVSVAEASGGNYSAALMVEASAEDSVEQLEEYLMGGMSYRNCVILGPAAVMRTVGWWVQLACQTVDVLETLIRLLPYLACQLPH